MGSFGVLVLGGLSSKSQVFLVEITKINGKGVQKTNNRICSDIGKRN